jgi:hypothetical protein
VNAGRDNDFKKIKILLEKNPAIIDQKNKVFFFILVTIFSFINIFLILLFMYYVSWAIQHCCWHQVTVISKLCNIWLNTMQALISTMMYDFFYSRFVFHI